MNQDTSIKVFINPLQMVGVDEPTASIQNHDIGFEELFKYFITPGIPSDIESIINRYKEISFTQPNLFAAPHEQRILDKLIWPLRHAKAGYACGNYLGTIALCGMVAEMVAIMLFQVSEFKLNDQPMSDKAQKEVFGNNFEKLGQHRRVSILSAYGVIDSKLKSSFDEIRTVRKRYLHLWSQDHDLLPTDAQMAFKAAIVIVVSAIGQKIKEGRLVLNPSMIEYLKKSGTYPADEDQDV